MALDKSFVGMVNAIRRCFDQYAMPPNELEARLDWARLVPPPSTLDNALLAMGNILGGTVRKRPGSDETLWLSALNYDHAGKLALAIEAHGAEKPSIETWSSRRGENIVVALPPELTAPFREAQRQFKDGYRKG